MTEFLSASKDLAPWVALIVSTAALWLSALNYQRDRAVLKATSHFYQSWQGFDASMGIKIVNAGRRPIIISTWVGAETKRSRFGRRRTLQTYGSYFDSKEGVTLKEGEAFPLTIEADELVAMPGDGEIIIFDDIWILDTLGRRHQIKNVRENVAKLWKWKSPVR
jgi:hypothetical protein